MSSGARRTTDDSGVVSVPAMVSTDAIPHWPDFTARPVDGAIFASHWVAETNTGRPGTPILAVVLHSLRPLEETEARRLLRRDFENAYASAHPNGCGPG